MTNGVAGRRWRLPAFWQAVIVLAAAVLLFTLAFPPFMPRSLLIAFMLITFIGVILYFSSDEEGWTEFKTPIAATLRDDNRWPVRWLLLIAVPMLVGYVTYSAIKPSLEMPPELRQVHPAPPGTLRVYNKTYDLSTLENPLREQVLTLLESEPEQGWEAYREAVTTGQSIYYRNCFFCHGDLLGGQGHFARGLDPLPTNFRDVGTIAQLQESFLFWRITTGGPGLPQGGMPWKSAMPVWHEMLSEEEVWSVITFLYDNVEQVPRMWDQGVSKAVTGMKDTILAQRAAMTAEDIYQFRCAVCHGETGAGDGPATDYQYPKPRDFTQGLFKYKTSAGALPPRDEDLFNVIKHGLVGTSMPGWSALLSDAQISDLVRLLKTFDTSAIWAPEDAPDEDFDDEGRYLKADLLVVNESEPTDGQIAYSSQSVARGVEVFEENCRKCHGEQGRGNLTSGKFLEDDWGERIWARDLTKPWSWRMTEAGVAETGSDEARRDATIRNIHTRLAVGIPGTPMPAHRATEEGEEDAIGPEDRWHVANYTYSLRGDTPPPGERSIIEGVQIAGELPENVADEAWQQAPPSTFRL
ncbi:MAG: c-type cytochrome, partial [Gammaproteobacteria bacterium]|nr:c-type cytochrome [Gammaproteobacteria bacterium]